MESKELPVSLQHYTNTLVHNIFTKYNGTYTMSLNVNNCLMLEDYSTSWGYYYKLTYRLTEQYSLKIISSYMCEYYNVCLSNSKGCYITNRGAILKALFHTLKVLRDIKENKEIANVS